MKRFTEKSVVEDYLIEQLQKNGWRYVDANELGRDSLEEPLLIKRLINAIKRINNDLGIGDEEIKEVLSNLRILGSGPEGNKQVLTYLNEGMSIKFEKENLLKRVKLIDYENISNNEFIVSRQVSFQSPNEIIRTDIVLFINGIPIVNIECKNPVSLTETWYNAYVQIKRYEKTIPELYKYVQIGGAIANKARYFPIVPWQDEVKTYEWKEEGVEDTYDAFCELFSPEKLLDIIKYFLFTKISMGKITKVIARYMQYRAVNKIVNRVLNNLEGKTDKREGLIWHWQGSGKTFEMIFAANKLYSLKKLENPTILFIIDRIDLEKQLFGELASLDIPSPGLISSVRDLKKVIKHDDYKGKRGLFVTLIQKFRMDELEDLRKFLVTMSKDKQTVMTRKNIIAFIDEGHRTQYGTLAAEMRSIFKNAFFFAFTGTPIAKKGRDTYHLFSPKGEKYLDRYFIKESINDGFTLKIVYQPRLEKEEGIKLSKELLNGFLEETFEELPENIREDVKERVKKRLSLIKMFLENPNRIQKVAEDIANHFKQNVDGKFKAMVVAASRKACVLYKRELDKLLPGYSEVVMTYNDNESDELIRKFREEEIKKWGHGDFKDIRDTIVEKFKEEEYPKILIVTDMLLTGFDAPILQTMYLDKPLKEHRLLQAIARTNRPYKGVKEAGLIIDYVGIFSNFKKAFQMYEEDEIEGAVYDINEIKKELKAKIKLLLDILKGVPRDKTDRDTLLKALEVLTSDEEKAKRFIENYKKLRRLFELLGPDELRVNLSSDYQWLTQIYIYYTRTVLKEDDSSKRYVKKYFDKTLRYVYRSTKIKELANSLPIIEFNSKYLDELEKKVKNKKEKAANIVFELNKFILVEKKTDPVYESLIEKVEKLVDRWKERVKDYNQIYKEGKDIFEEINKLHRRKEQLGFSDLEYGVLVVLENKFGQSNTLARDVRNLFDKLKPILFKGWTIQPTAVKNVEREIRLFLRKKYYKKKPGVNTLKQFNELYNKIIKMILENGELLVQS